MSKRKKYRQGQAHAGKQAVKQAAPVRKPRRLPKLPVWGVVGVGLWLWLWLVWGDVLHMAEQYSYFSWDKTAMMFVLLQWDWLVLMGGRLLLTLFYYPVVGAAVMSVLLTVAAWAVSRIGRGHWIATVVGIVLSLGYAGWLAHEGLCTFFEAEPGYIFGRLLVGLVAAIVLWGAAWLVGRKRRFELSVRTSWFVGLGTVVALVVMAVLTLNMRENQIITCKMQRALETDDYERMIELGLSARQASRSVAAYYVLALSQTDQVVDRAFDLFYQYPAMKMRSRDGRLVSGTLYYAPDVDYYAGLVNSAYHESLERIVMDGLTVWRLKRLCLAAILNGELEAAAKMIHLLRLCPFEKRFVEEYSPYVFDGVEPKSNPVFARVIELIPIRDNFEQALKQPLFLGYNSILTEGRSLRALTNSIMTCMYAKNKQTFAERVPALRGQWPRVIQEAYLVYNIKDPDVFKDPHIDKIVVARMQQFMQDIKPIVKEDKKEIALKLKEKYLGFYPFYYYYQNIPDENYQEHEAPKDNTAR